MLSLPGWGTNVSPPHACDGKDSVKSQPPRCHGVVRTFQLARKPQSRLQPLASAVCDIAIPSAAAINNFTLLTKTTPSQETRSIPIVGSGPQRRATAGPDQSTRGDSNRWSRPVRSVTQLIELIFTSTRQPAMRGRFQHGAARRHGYYPLPLERCASNLNGWAKLAKGGGPLTPAQTNFFASLVIFGTAVFTFFRASFAGFAKRHRN